MGLVDIETAARLLRAGEVVAIPTETVYGLAANALDEAAVRRVFALKGRPADHPLILHARDPRPWAHFDARAERLAVYWPGPLTLVLPRRAVPDVVTGGRDTVAVRVPGHPVALDLLDHLDFPLAAPSANRFGQVSPTTAAHVLQAFAVPVLDGGACGVGVESTIVDLSRPQPSILRPGAIDADAVCLALGEELAPASDTPAPGTLPSHYAPRARVVLVDHAPPDSVALRRRAPADYARALYAELRALDVQGPEVIYAERCEPVGVGVAVNDRLERAAYSVRPPSTSTTRPVK